MDLRKWQIFSLLNDNLIKETKLACVFGSQGNEAILVMKNDDVYAFGTNSYGCLAIADSQSSLIPIKIDCLSGVGLVGFAYGSGPHVLALTANGELYTWGHNGYSELANGSTCNSSIPLRVENALADKVVVEIACGNHHCVALTNEGEVFAWGQNKVGQIGSSINNSNNHSTPRRVNSTIGGKFIIGIACGQTYSIVVTNNGEVYGWGCNANGQLGIGNTVNQLTPCRVMVLSNTVIVKVVCGTSHTLALSDEGQLYGWGANSFGQLALPLKNNIATPEKIAGDIGRVVDIAAHHYCNISVALTQNAKVYIWGQCRGQQVLEPVLSPFTNIHEAFASMATPPITHKPVTIFWEHFTTIEDSLTAAFDDEETSDIIVRVEKRNIYVHKAVLKIRCQHFRSMFQQHWKEDKNNVLEIEQYCYPVYRAFLRYLYTDSVELAPEQALELLDLANAYCEDALKRLCEKKIRQSIDIENAALLYYTALTFQAKELEEFCFRFSLNHMTAVVQSKNFAELDEMTIKNFILKAAKAGAFKT